MKYNLYISFFAVFCFMVCSAMANSTSFKPVVIDVEDVSIVKKDDYTISYWGYQNVQAVARISSIMSENKLGESDEDDEADTCYIKIESGSVTIMWSLICWDGGKIEIPCELVDVSELLD